ncbi:hypothetical protein CPLU01_08224 [Colletotrichum plurivorum]|uniref:Uncharacterized protein n=1 Tax=Colletotrichum plurivorum TaxID=2175906 RepID=A0A8H6KCS0_9PEZI|nr:hypothetical protein CPLU01_08224 [Colletotrichum plurivorum]
MRTSKVEEDDNDGDIDQPRETDFTQPDRLSPRHGIWPTRRFLRLRQLAITSSLSLAGRQAPLAARFASTPGAESSSYDILERSPCPNKHLAQCSASLSAQTGDEACLGGRECADDMSGLIRDANAALACRCQRRKRPSPVQNAERVMSDRCG